jgi:hypothetical protein
MYYYESKFKVENDKLVEYNLHKEIREDIERHHKESVESLNKIDAEIKKLRQKGFKIIYSLVYNPGDF